MHHRLVLLSQLNQLPQLNNWERFRSLWNHYTAQPRQDWVLPLLAAEAAGMGNDRLDALTPLVPTIMALFQLSIVLIDGILDQDKPFVESMGYGAAANLASALQGAGGELVDQLPVPAETKTTIAALLAKMMVETAVGQDADVTGVDVGAGTEAAYWYLVQQKSGPFYGAAWSLGGLLAEADALTVETLNRSGRLLGEMLQIQDDLFDCMAIPAAHDWLGNGDNNLLILYGKLVNYAEKERFLNLWGQIRAGAEAETLEAAQQILIDAGAVAYCDYMLKHKQAQATKLFTAANLPTTLPLLKILEEVATIVDRIEE